MRAICKRTSIEITLENATNFAVYALLRLFSIIDSPRAGADNLWDQKVDHDMKLILPRCVCCKSRENSVHLRFYKDFFMILYMYIALEQGQITNAD